MRDEEFDALVRQALQDDPWRPDLAAAERRFADRIAHAGRHAGPDRFKARLAEWLRAAQPGVIVVATASAVVAVALLVAGPALVVRDSANDGSDRLASGRDAQRTPVPQRPPVDPPAGPQRSSDRAPDAQVPRSATGPAPQAPRPPESAPTIPPSAGSTAVQPYTANQVCGEGFRIINQHRLSGGVVYLLWNGATQENCVVTLKTAYIGQPTRTTAYLTPDGAGTSRDAGNYRYYANVTARSPGCIQWGGSDARGEFTSPSGVHCAPGR